MPYGWKTSPSLLLITPSFSIIEMHAARVYTAYSPARFAFCPFAAAAKTRPTLE
jgi:hypothetical protein